MTWLTIASIRAARVVWKRATDTTIKAQAAWRIGSRLYSWPRFCLGPANGNCNRRARGHIPDKRFLGREILCPVKCYTNLFVQPGQLAQVNRPPQPPREEAREIETENTRDAHPATN